MSGLQFRNVRRTDRSIQHLKGKDSKREEQIKQLVFFAQSLYNVRFGREKPTFLFPERPTRTSLPKDPLLKRMTSCANLVSTD